MTHPADKVYHFATLEQWGLGLADNLLFGSGDAILTTASDLEACEVAVAAEGDVVALAVDPCGRLLWLLSGGAVMRLHASVGPVQVAQLPARIARETRRLLWGQRTGWAVSRGVVVRIDARTGGETGRFEAPGWRAVDAVPDRCDGVVVLERPTTEATTVRLRQIRPDGAARMVLVLDGFTEPVAAVRWGETGAIHLLDRCPDGLRVVSVDAEGAQTAQIYPGTRALGPVTMEGPGRLVLADPDGPVFTLAFGLVEATRPIRAARPFGALRDLAVADGVLYAAIGRRVYALREGAAASEARQARYFGPALRSPLGVRSGWLRADLAARLPKGAAVKIAARGFAGAIAARAYDDALRGGDPEAPELANGWNEADASLHYGDGTAQPLRHYLGDEEAEYLALRIDLSVPAGAPPAALTRMDVLYPDRSLVEELPAIYRTGTGSERQLRRMLAPFQALADEVDDLIGDAIRRVDPRQTDDLWTGFLLGWLGHGAFARLPAAERRGLLVALPEILRLRGTMAGLVRVLEVLAPEGFEIEDSGAGPDFWVLPDAADPAGARLGRGTWTAPHAPQVLVAGGCVPLGAAALRHACLDLGRLAPCSGDVTVRIRGGEARRTRLQPFEERIARHFVPANTRLVFDYGDHRPPELLERPGGIGPEAPGDALFTLDGGHPRGLGAWRLPRDGPVAPQAPPVLDSAVLDGGLTLE